MSEQYRKARKRARRKIGFYKHLKAYVVINVFIAAINIIDGDPMGWFPMPFFWGIGLLMHYINVFGLPGTDGLYTENWEEKIFDEELEQIKKEEEEREELELRQIKQDKRKAWDDSDLV
jgi:hypothetical protein